ncbi:hypothetical protein ACFVWG_24005 [Kribbella sp. NPDC058245]|uniref:phage head completion protein n=1 Tax=Kribbella sp. NPDC058245 TaxID=3346399 RepID=UPI0036E53DD4
MLGPHTITVVRPGTKPAEYGNTTQPDWANPTATTVAGCSVQPIPAPAYTVDQDSSQTRWSVWAPGGTDVQATDRVLWNGDTYDVDGAPQRWHFGRLSHVVINLRRSTDA